MWVPKRMFALGYRIFGALRWGMLGDGHISALELPRLPLLMNFLVSFANPLYSTLSVGEAIGLEQFGHPRFHVCMLLPGHP